MKGLAKEEIKIESVLSNTGGFGIVYRGEARKSQVAIKIPRNTLSAKQVEDFRKEVAILSSVFHPNICLFLGAYIGDNEIIIVNELLEGNVAELLSNRNVSLSMTQKLKMNEDAARGLAWLHGSGIVHRDVKPQNYLYKRLGENSFQIKVCDFGLSDLQQQGGNLIRENNPKGTPLYMAPEVLLSRPLSEKVDVYSWAITLWEIVTGHEPYATISSVEKLVHHVCVEHQRPPFPPSFGKSLCHLMNAAWHAAPDQRPSFEEIATLMHNVLIESSINDVNGQLFWKTSFAAKENVPFREFCMRFFNQFEALKGKMPPEEEETPSMSGYVGEVKKGTLFASPHAGIPVEPHSEAALMQLRVHFVRLLRLLFVDDGVAESVVNIEDFGKVLDWVGPIEADDCFSFFFRVARLFSKPWFFGGIRTNDATSLLLTKPPGTYLVRFCNNPSFPGYYVLSTVTVSGTGTVVAHVRIRHKPGEGFELEKIQNSGVFNSVEELIDGVAQKLNLRKACPNRKYEYALFEHLQDELRALELAYAGRKGLNESGAGAMELSGDGY